MNIRIRTPDRRTVRILVDGCTFASLRRSIAQKFALQNESFELYLGDNQLPKSDERIVESNFGIVDGDLLRLVAPDFSYAEETEEVARKSTAMETVGGSEAVTTESFAAAELPFSEASFIEMVVSEMEKSGFSVVSRSADGYRLEFTHPANSLASVEVDFRLYSEFGKHCMRVVASVVSHVQRSFLDPVLLTWGSPGLETSIADEVVKEIRERVLGNDNLLLRVLSMRGISELVLGNLDVRSLVRFEGSCRTARQLCTNKESDLLWKKLIEQDFQDASLHSGETYRMCYRRYHENLMRAQNMAIFPESYFDSISERPRPRPIPTFPFGPEPGGYPDPDLPTGPFGGGRRPDFPGPYLPTAPQFPRPRNPLDPMFGSELMPSRPRYPQGLPRQFPRGPTGGEGFYGSNFYG